MEPGQLVDEEFFFSLIATLSENIFTVVLLGFLLNDGTEGECRSFKALLLLSAYA